MAYHNFIPYVTKGIIVKFKCLNCGNEIEEEISVPWTDMESDDIGVEDTIENDSIQCPDCEKEYSYSIVSYGDFEIDDLENEEVDFFDTFNDVPKSEELSDGIILLQKWNSRLLLKEPSKKFIELVLEKDPSKDSSTIRREWFNEKLLSKDSFFREDSS
jgi:DNA-directed RNA polymerase subunit RPC12/RpoP